jgi:hypothetical protein
VRSRQRTTFPKADDLSVLIHSDGKSHCLKVKSTTTEHRKGENGTRIAQTEA